MKENEPKVKDSQKYFDLKIRDEYWFESDKATYDRLVTLEAKIEMLNEFYPTESVIVMMEAFESELAQLVKELCLTSSPK